MPSLCDGWPTARRACDSPRSRCSSGPNDITGCGHSLFYRRGSEALPRGLGVQEAAVGRHFGSVEPLDDVLCPLLLVRFLCVSVLKMAFMWRSHLISSPNKTKRSALTLTDISSFNVGSKEPQNGGVCVWSPTAPLISTQVRSSASLVFSAANCAGPSDQIPQIHS